MKLETRALAQRAAATATRRATEPLPLYRIAAILAVLVGTVSFFVFASNPVPSEDAAILFRYSENLASGFGIVYNPGGPRVDGATDMLFMAALAALRFLGMSVETGAALVNATSLALICCLVFLSWCRWGGLRARWALLPVLVVLVGPVWQYGLDGFGTITFSAACCAVAVASEWATRQVTTRRLAVLGLLVAVTGLIRPEGFILGALIVVAQGIRVRNWRIVVVPTLIWLSVTSLFVGWRLWYFGYPLPNTFYKKAGGTLHFVGIRSTAALLFRAGLPVLILMMLGLVVPRSRRRATVLFVVISGWALAWLLISDEGNALGRFQYPVLAALVVLSAPLYSNLSLGLNEIPAWKTRVLRASFAAILLLNIAFMTRLFLVPSVQRAGDSGRALETNIHAQVATIMRDNVDGRKRTAAVTEAGYVAWKSGWQIVDLWGLNDKNIAHNGYLSVDDLERLRPELIFAALPTSNHVTSSRAREDVVLPGWTAMSEPLLCYTAREQYVLIGQWGDSASFVVLADPTLPDLEKLRDEFATVRFSGQSNSASEGPLPVPKGCAIAAVHVAVGRGFAHGVM